jgi:predicted peroxiredoxin
MATLSKKGYARIYVGNADDIDRVKQIIKEIDSSEFGYLPDKLIAPFSEYPKLCYTHKFDAIDMNTLTAECWKRGVKIWVCDNGYRESIDDIKKST